MEKDLVLFDSYVKKLIFKKDVRFKMKDENCCGFIYITEDDILKIYGEGIDFQKFKDKENIVLYIDFSHYLLVIETQIKIIFDTFIELYTPTYAYRIQQRDFLRVNTDIPCIVNEQYSLYIKNISGNGALIVANEKINIGNIINLSFNISNKDFSITCEIVNFDKNFMRVKFIKFIKGNESYIVRYCLKKDLEYHKGMIY